MRGYGAVDGARASDMAAATEASNQRRGLCGPARGAAVVVAAAVCLLAFSVLVAQPLAARRAALALQPRAAGKGATGTAEVEAAMPTTQLLGFDPLRSNAGGHSSPPNTLQAFEQAEDQQNPLPTWATEWADKSNTKCDVGAQCDHGNVPNPLGSLGRWVMIKTAPHFNSDYDYSRRHGCANLPGWAVEECFRMRDAETHLDEEGNSDGTPVTRARKSASRDAFTRDKSTPTMLHDYRSSPFVRRALPARRRRIRDSSVALAQQVVP